MILCSGCFDGLHAGHVAYLRGASCLLEPGERLVVAVACNDYIVRHKGRQPFWDFHDRSDVLIAVRYVDQVWLHGSQGAAEVIRWIKPRLFVKGEDWRLLGLPEDVVAACNETGCTIAFVNTGDHKHTSDALPPHQ